MIEIIFIAMFAMFLPLIIIVLFGEKGIISQIFMKNLRESLDVKEKKKNT